MEKSSDNIRTELGRYSRDAVGYRCAGPTSQCMTQLRAPMLFQYRFGGFGVISKDPVTIHIHRVFKLLSQKKKKKKHTSPAFPQSISSAAPNSSPLSNSQQLCLRHQSSRSAQSRTPIKRHGRTFGANTMSSTSAPSPTTSQKPPLIVSSTRRTPSPAR
jgi:hypothetical protein